MVPFKVKCVDALNLSGILKTGEIYTVIQVRGDPYLLDAAWRSDIGNPWFLASRFVHLEETSI